MKGSQTPKDTPAAAAWEANGTPKHTAMAIHGLDMGDEGMTGHDPSDKIMLMNAHPHQAHSVGYEDSTLGTTYENHGFESVHIKHGNRQKGSEHHPPLGLR